MIKNRRGEIHLLVAAHMSVVAVSALALQAADVGPDATLWGQLLNAAAILGVGLYGLRTLFKLRDDYQEHRRQAAIEDATRREQLQEEIRKVEARCLTTLEKDIDLVRQDFGRMERALEKMTDAVAGSPLNPDGLINTARKDARRRHDIMSNMQAIVARQALMSDLLVSIAKKIQVPVDEKVMEAIKSPLNWAPEDAK
jgi:hypothetical protein